MRFLQIRSACGWMSDRCCGHFGSQPGSYQRNRRGSAICKKRSQKCGVATLILLNICFSFISATYMTNTTYKSQLEILSICKYTINNISNSITSICTCLINTDIANHITSILHSNGMNTRDR